MFGLTDKDDKTTDTTVEEATDVAVEETANTVETPTPAIMDGDNSQGRDKDFVEFVVKQLVDNPNAVQINRRLDELGVFITVSVAKEDMGKLIGKNGQTVDALRVLLRVIGAKENNRVNLKVVEPDEMNV